MARSGRSTTNRRDPFPAERGRKLYRVNRRRVIIVAGVTYRANEEVILGDERAQLHSSQITLVGDAESTPVRETEPVSAPPETRTRAVDEPPQTTMRARKKS